MSTNVGFATHTAYGLEGTWGTAVAVTHALRHNSDTLDQTRAKITKATNVGSGARERNKATHKVAGGGLTFDLTYDLVQPWLIHFFGALVDDSTDYYQMAHQIESSLTVALDRVVSVHEYSGLVIDQATLTGDSDNGVMVEWTTTAKERLRGGSAINNATAIEGVPDTEGCVLFHECTLRLGEMGSPLDVSNDMNMSQFSLAMNRNKTAQPINSLYRLQSKENGHRDFLLNVTMPRYESDQVLDWEEGDVPLQGNLIMTNGTRTLDWRFSHLSVEQVPIGQSDDSQAEVPITLRLHRNRGFNTNPGFDFEPDVQLYVS